MKYLFHGSYTLDGVKGLLKEGGSSRKSHFSDNVRNLGGQVESFYYAFGLDDIYAVVDLPDNVSSTALSLAISTGGAFRMTTIVLLSPQEIDLAVRKVAEVGYRPPGQ